MIVEINGITGSGKTTSLNAILIENDAKIFSSDLVLIDRILAIPATIIFFIYLVSVNFLNFQYFHFLRLANYLTAMLLKVFLSRLTSRVVVIDQFLLQFCLSLDLRNLRGGRGIVLLIRFINQIDSYVIYHIDVGEKLFLERYHNRLTYTSAILKEPNSYFVNYGRMFQFRLNQLKDQIPVVYKQSELYKFWQ